LREEEFGAIKTLKRHDHTNSSVGIDGMNDYQATYNKRWPNQSFLSVNVFVFVGSRPHQHHDLVLLQQADHDEMLKLDFISAMICTLICQICRLGSVDRALRYTIRRLPVLIHAMRICPSGESARTLFVCANESSFAKTIQLFKKPDACSSEMRLQNG
jgi:hypothetical protein